MSWARMEVETGKQPPARLLRTPPEVEVAVGCFLIAGGLVGLGIPPSDHLAWTVALLPLPRDWTRARTLLAPLAGRAWGGDPPRDDELHAAVLDAYRLQADAVAPLLEWARR